MSCSFLNKNNESIIKKVDEVLEDNNLVELSNIFENFEVVVKSIENIYASTLDLPCGAMVVQIVFTFHSLVNKMVGTVAKFKLESKESIKLFNTAIKYAEEDPQLAVECIKKTVPKAEYLVTATKELVEMIDIITMDLGKTLVKATGEKSMNLIENDRITEQKVEIMGKIARLKAEIADYNQQAEDFQALAKRESNIVVANLVVTSMSNLVSIVAPVKGAIGKIIVNLSTDKPNQTDKKKEKEKEKDQVGDSSQNERKQQVPNEITYIQSKRIEKDELKVKIDNHLELKDKKEKEIKGLMDNLEHVQVLNLTQEITNLDKEIKTFNEQLIQIGIEINSFEKSIISKSQDKELAYSKLKSEYKDLSRQSNANLEQSLVQMNGLGARSTNLEKTIRSLEVAIMAMGIIKINFDNIRLFWDQVHDVCKELTDVSLVSLMVGKSEFTNSIKNSGIQWCAINVLNGSTDQEIKRIKLAMDIFLSNLPNSEQAKQIVQQKIEDNKKNIISIQ